MNGLPWLKRLRRRDVLKGLGALSLVPLLGGCGDSTDVAVAPPPEPAVAPRVVIVGAGLAGLNAAYILQKQGVASQVYEASDRIGGRVFTASGIFGPNIVTELGAEFIDTEHTDMLALVQELGLTLLDVAIAGEAGFEDRALLAGEFLDEGELEGAFASLIPRIKADYATLAGIPNFQSTDPNALRLDNLSLAAYIDSLEPTGPIREALRTAYTTENGLDTEGQSSLNLIVPIGLSEDDGLLGDSDERFKVVGGNQQVPLGLAQRLAQPVLTGHRLVAVRQDGQGFVASFETGGRTVDVAADYLVLALPFTLLRSVRLPELPALKVRAIQEEVYGTNSKVILGFPNPFWRVEGRSGNFLCEPNLQEGWDSSRLQPGPGASLTMFFGGRRGVESGEGTAESQAQACLPRLDQLFPGASAAYTGVARRFHWPTYPYSLGSYSTYGVGQWTTIGGSEGLPVGNLLFAGEHTSIEWKGFMNGAAQTGREAAQTILARLGRPVGARPVNYRLAWNSGLPGIPVVRA